VLSRPVPRGLLLLQVIDHRDGELADVFREAKLLLSLKHDNIVKAYSFLTCTWSGPATQPPGETSSRGAATSCTPSDATQPASRDVHQQQQGPAAVDVVNNGDDSISNAQCGAVAPAACVDSFLGGPQPTTAGLMRGPGDDAAGAPVVSCAAAADALGPGSSSRTTSTPSTSVVAVPAIAVKIKGSCSPAGQPRSMQSAGTGRSGSSSSRGSGDNIGGAVRTWIIMEYCDSGDLSSVVRVLRSGLETSLDTFMVNSTAASTYNIHIHQQTLWHTQRCPISG
jgi:serine/threonine protein kinase